MRWHAERYKQAQMSHHRPQQRTAVSHSGLKNCSHAKDCQKVSLQLQHLQATELLMPHLRISLAAPLYLQYTNNHACTQPDVIHLAIWTCEHHSMLRKSCAPATQGSPGSTWERAGCNLPVVHCLSSSGQQATNMCIILNPRHPPPPHTHTHSA